MEQFSDSLLDLLNDFFFPLYFFFFMIYVELECNLNECNLKNI